MTYESVIKRLKMEEEKVEREKSRLSDFLPKETVERVINGAKENLKKIRENMENRRAVINCLN